MNFVLLEMTFLRYFIPLIIEGNKQGINSYMYWAHCGKYNCPALNYSFLIDLSNKYNFKLIKIDKPIKSNNSVFFIEGVGIDLIDSPNKLSMTYMTDYQLSWDKYWDKINYCIFPSKHFSQKIKKQDDPKSLHFGSTKYDLDLNLVEIKKNYNMSHKNVLLLYPKLRDINKINVTNIINTLHELDYKIFIKTRGKDPIHDVSSFKGIVIHDGNWFPHPSIDLMYACDFVINFDSTAIKEAAVLKTPVINYHIKPKGHGAPTRLDFLLNENFIFHVQDNIDHLKQTIKTIEMTDFSNYFEKTIQAKFFNRREVCKKILSFIK
jgi:hypothetical protein